MKTVFFVLLSALAGHVAVRKALAARRLQRELANAFDREWDLVGRVEELKGERDHWCERFSESQRILVDGRISSETDRNIFRVTRPLLPGCVITQDCYIYDPRKPAN